MLPRARALSRHRLLARLDAGVALEARLRHDDAAETRAIFDDSGDAFILKWNPRRQNLVGWLSQAETEAGVVWTRPREGKRVAVFSETVAETWGAARPASSAASCA